MSRLRDRQIAFPDKSKDEDVLYDEIVNSKEHSNEKLNYVVFVLIVIFSIASWIDMVGVFSELPLMVPVLPEGWNLSVYFCLSIEIPFIAPVIIYILILLKPKIINYPVAIIIIIITGTTSLGLLSKFWSRTIMVAGQKRSVPLLALVTSLGLVDSCSSVVFYPYMKRYNPMYMSAVLVGESLTGFIPAIMKVIQGGAEPYCSNQTMSKNDSFAELYTEPRFSVSAYLIVLSCLMMICLVAFLLLEIQPTLKKVQLFHGKENENVDTVKHGDLMTRRKLTRMEYINFMVVMFVSAFVVWGLISAFYTYSILPFGFKITNNSIIIINGIRFSAVFFAYKRPIEKTLFINLIMIFLLSISTYMLICAIYSPCPPLVGTTIGSFLAAFCLISVDYFSTYMRSCVVKRISYHGGNVLVTCAMVTKSGVMLGAIVATVLVQKTTLFRARRFCEPLLAQCDGYRSKYLRR